MAFLVCVYSHDVSECLVAHHADRGIFSCVYLHMTFLVGPIYKGLVAHPTSKWFFSCAHFLLTFLVGPIDKDRVAHPVGFSPVCLFTWHFSISRRTSCRLFSYVYLLVTFRKVLWHILQENGFSPLCIFAYISKCLIATPAGIGLFSCVYLLMMFQNVLSHILWAKGFLLCLSSWCFQMSRRTSCKHWAFLLFVSSHDVSECLISYPADKGLSSCMYLGMTFLVVLINKGLVAYPTGKNAFLLYVSSHDISECLLVHLEGKCLFSMCIFSWRFRMSLETSCR